MKKLHHYAELKKQYQHAIDALILMAREAMRLEEENKKLKEQLKFK